MTSGVSAGRTWAANAPKRKPRRARSAGRTCVGAWGVWLGGTDWGDCGRKVSTQRKYACVFAGSDVRGKCISRDIHGL